MPPRLILTLLFRDVVMNATPRLLHLQLRLLLLLTPCLLNSIQFCFFNVFKLTNFSFCRPPRNATRLTSLPKTDWPLSVPVS